MAEERPLNPAGEGSSSAPNPSTQAGGAVGASVMDYSQGFSMLNGSGLPDQPYYYGNSGIPPGPYMDSHTWSSAGTQVPPLDPGFLPSGAGMSSLGSEQAQYLASDQQFGMAQNYGGMGPYYSIITQGDAGTGGGVGGASSSYPWSDPMMNNLFNPADGVYTQAPFTAGLDVQAAGTEGLPPVDAAGALPLTTPFLNTGFSTSGIDNMADLERSLQSLSTGYLGTSTGLSAADQSPAGTGIPGLVNMSSVMATGISGSQHQTMSPRGSAMASSSTATHPMAGVAIPPSAASTVSESSSAAVAAAAAAIPSSQVPAPPAASSAPQKPMSWATVAGAPPKKQPPPPAHFAAPSSSAAPSSLPGSTQAPGRSQPNHYAPPPGAHAWQQQQHQRQAGPVPAGGSSLPMGGAGAAAGGNAVSRAPRHRSKPAVGDVSGLDRIEPAESDASEGLEKLRAAHEYNPKDPSVVKLNDARFFVIKSYSEDDIHRSIKYSVWTSTEHGNKRLDSAFREQRGRPVYLYFSVNGSGHFCGCARMCSEVDYTAVTGIWSQDKWKGKFDVKWIYVKDVPNSQLRHIRLENNENKPVTNSRDTQEVPPEKARQVMKILHSYRHTTSIFDDFGHYEKRQEEGGKRSGAAGSSAGRKGGSH